MKIEKETIDIRKNIQKEIKTQEVIKKVEKEKSPKKQEEILKKSVEDFQKERTMNLSIKEGATASVMTGMGTSYITPYALALGANNLHIGFLSSFAALLPPISQLFGSRLMERFSRKKIITTFVFFQALMWIPILLLSLFFWKNIFTLYLPIILIAFYTLYAIFGAIAGPSWFSLLGDIVPEKIRGRYFGKRNKIAETVALVSLIAGSFILDYFKTKGLVLLGFSLLFIVACIFRLISSKLFKKHHDPKFKLEKGYYFSFWEFLKKAPTNNFGKFAIFIAITHFATAIAGPFFAVYMLKDLGFSYVTFMLVNISASIISLLFMPLLGKFSDKFGNRDLVKFGSMLIPLVPLLWIISSNPIYLIFIPQIISGVGWAAIGLGSSNFIYDSVSIPRRGICVAYYNLTIGIGAFAGATIGGILTQYIPITFMNKILFVFLISGILRAIVPLIMLPKIKEIRTGLKKPGKSPIHYFTEIKPMKGIVLEIINDVKGIEQGIRHSLFHKRKKAQTQNL